jgi:hypothetical protein
MRLRGVLLVLALLLVATAVVPVLLLGAAEHGVAPAPPFKSSRVKAVSWQPRIFVYKGFLSDAECDHLVRLGKAKVQRSMVADNLSGKSVMSEVRTSSGTFLDKRQVPYHEQKGATKVTAHKYIILVNFGLASSILPKFKPDPLASGLFRSSLSDHQACGRCNNPLFHSMPRSQRWTSSRS